LEREDEQPGARFPGFMTGVETVEAAVTSVAAASEAGALRHDPETVGTAVKKLDDFQGVLRKILERSRVLATRTPLGGGYAHEVGEFNKRIGEVADTRVIPDLIKAIDELKTELNKSRRSYRNVEESTSGTMNRL
jgi:hypothetical protein